MWVSLPTCPLPCKDSLLDWTSLILFFGHSHPFLVFSCSLFFTPFPNLNAWKRLMITNLAKGQKNIFSIPGQYLNLNFLFITYFSEGFIEFLRFSALTKFHNVIFIPHSKSRERFLTFCLFIHESRMVSPIK